MSTVRQTLSFFFSVLLVCPLASAQSPSNSHTPAKNAQQDLKRARKAEELGDKAEAAGRFAEALVYFEEAARYAPMDANIVGHAAALRSKLIRAHVEAAERDALAGDLDQATGELAEALAIDPGNTIVLERLRELKSMEDELAPNPRGGSKIPGLPLLKPQPGKRNIDLRGDTKTVYEQLASMFGLKAAFDPDLIVRSVRLSVNDVDFNTALTILATETATFSRPLDAATLFVAADTTEKRRQFALQAEQTFALSAAVGAEDATEVLRIVREITGSSRIDLDSRSHTITMRDTPERLALADALIQQIERARGEVML